MLLVWRRRQDIEVQRTRVLAQAAIAAASEDDSGSKPLKQAWSDYLDETFPFQKSNRINSDQQAIAFLKEIAKHGPLHIIPLQPLTKVPSRLRSRSKT